jgi:hypothetical protein
VRRLTVPKRRCGSILLKKVFRGVERIFSEAPVRSFENDVGGHVISPISDQRPPQSLCDALDYEDSISTGAQAKISIGSFLPFSTVSVISGRGG